MRQLLKTPIFLRGVGGLVYETGQLISMQNWTFMHNSQCSYTHIHITTDTSDKTSQDTNIVTTLPVPSYAGVMHSYTNLECTLDLHPEPLVELVNN